MAKEYSIMKIFEKKPGHPDSIRLLELSEKDVDAILTILSPPFGDINEYTGETPINPERIKEIRNILKSIKPELNQEVEPGFLLDLTCGFKAACDVIDPLEMRTITHFSWIEAMELYQRLFTAAHCGPIKKTF